MDTWVRLLEKKKIPANTMNLHVLKKQYIGCIQVNPIIQGYTRLQLLLED